MLTTTRYVKEQHVDHNQIYDPFTLKSYLPILHSWCNLKYHIWLRSTWVQLFTILQVELVGYFFMNLIATHRQGMSESSLYHVMCTTHYPWYIVTKPNCTCAKQSVSV